ncbi:MAG: hypothetical protein F2806_02100 [Actinobacteria bacterium]|nr:hypothetical protein [Actinomycetota bacterium]
MKKAIMRAVIATGAIALAVSSAPISTAAAQSDRGYVGTWELKAWNIDGTSIDCPGKLPVPPPAPAIECKGGEYLKLTKNSRYRSNLSVFQTRTHPNGSFGVLDLLNSPTKTIVFYSDTARKDPRAYNMDFKRGSNGLDSMVISLEFSVGPEKNTYIKMIFTRKAS